MAAARELTDQRARRRLPAACSRGSSGSRGAKGAGRHWADAHSGHPVWPLVPVQHPVQHVSPACTHHTRTGCRNRTTDLHSGILAFWRLLTPSASLHSCAIHPRSYNKQLLKGFPYPVTITAFQFLVGGLLACAMWLTRLHKKAEGSFVENVRWQQRMGRNLVAGCQSSTAGGSPPHHPAHPAPAPQLRCP